MNIFFKTALLAFALATINWDLSAQTVSVHAKATAGISNMGELSSSRMVYAAGGDFRYLIGERAGLVFDLGYALRGRREVLVGGSGQYDDYEAISSLRAHYLQAALSLSYEPLENLSFMVGPYIGIRTVCTAQVRESWVLAGVPGERNYKSDVSNQYEGMDVGIQVNIEYSLGDKLAVFAQFQQGFLNVYAIDLLNIRRINQALSLGLAVRLLEK